MDQKLVDILFYTTLSPSAHNTQPWQIKVVDTTIYILADIKRRLGKSDTHNREFYVSLGAAVANTVLAAEAMSATTHVTPFPNGESDICVAAINITFNPAPHPQNDTLLTALRQRQSKRLAYDRRPLEEELTRAWEAQAIGSKINLHIITDADKKQQLAEISARANKEALQDEDFKAELSFWLRHNLTSELDGMPGYSMGLPTPISFIFPWMIRHLPLGSMQAAMERTFVTSSSAVIVLTGPDTPLGYLEAGQLYEQIVIHATQHGLSNATSAAAIETGTFYQQLQRVLGTDERPLVFFRVGYCKNTVKATPKRNLADLLIP